MKVKRNLEARTGMNVRRDDAGLIGLHKAMIEYKNSNDPPLWEKNDVSHPILNIIACF